MVKKLLAVLFIIALGLTSKVNASTIVFDNYALGGSGAFTGGGYDTWGQFNIHDMQGSTAIIGLNWYLSFNIPEFSGTIIIAEEDADGHVGSVVWSENYVFSDLVNTAGHPSDSSIRKMEYTFSVPWTSVTVDKNYWVTIQPTAGVNWVNITPLGGGLTMKQNDNYFSGWTTAMQVVAAPAPEPVDVTLFSAVEIGWASVSGQSYQVQCSTNLASTNWFNLGDSVIGNGSTNSVFDSTRHSSERFYRVINE